MQMVEYCRPVIEFLSIRALGLKVIILVLEVECLMLDTDWFAWFTFQT